MNTERPPALRSTGHIQDISRLATCSYFILLTSVRQYALIGTCSGIEHPRECQCQNNNLIWDLALEKSDYWHR